MERLKASSPVRVERPDRPYAYKVVLPSRGYLYGGRLPGGEVIISPMTVAEEKILAGGGRDRALDVLDLVVKRCLVDCPVPYEDLLLGDTFFLMMCIRNVSYGADYRFNISCGVCDKVFSYSLRIPEDLELTVLTEEDDCEPYEVKLPVRGDTVGFCLLRNKDEAFIRRQLKSSYRSTLSPGDPSYSFRLASYIRTVNGEELPMAKKLEYVEGLLGMDSLALRNAIDDRECGVSLILHIECPNCGYEGEELMPFGKEFFRPKSSGVQN